MSWTHRIQDIKVGDRVAYSRQFLRSIGCYTGDMPHARGTVTGLVQVGSVTLADIDWNLPDLPARVIEKNLVLASRLAFEL